MSVDSPFKTLCFENIALIFLQKEGRPLFDQNYVEVNRWMHSTCTRKLSLHLMQNKDIRESVIRQILSQSHLFTPKLIADNSDVHAGKPYGRPSYICWCGSCRYWLSDFDTLATHIRIHEQRISTLNGYAYQETVSYQYRTCGLNSKIRSRALINMYNRNTEQIQFINNK